MLYHSLSSLETYNYRPELEDTNDIKQGRYTNLDSTIKDLQDKMQYLDPLDRVIFTCKRKKTEKPCIVTYYLGSEVYLQELYDKARNEVRFPIFYSADFITIPNFSLLDTAIGSIFGEHATSANLVLGSSTPDHIRHSMKNNYRNIEVHFEDPKLPTTIHWGTAIYSVELTLHDIYHLFMSLHTPPGTHTLLTQTGAKLHNIADNKNQSIEDTLVAVKNTKLPVDTPENIDKSAKSLLGIHNFLSYLKQSRKTLNQHDFMIHDGNFSTIDENKSTVRGIMTTHIKDMCMAFNSHAPHHMKDFITPFNMKQICKVVGLQLEEQFNYLVANNRIENNKFAQILYQGICGVLEGLLAYSLPIKKGHFFIPDFFNQYNFLASMQAYLLENYPQLNQKEDTGFIATNNDTSLHNCINTLSIEELKKQIDSGIQLDSKNTEGDTILHILTKIKPEDRHKDYSKIINTLIKSGINLDIQNNNGETALHCAIKNNGLSRLAKTLINSNINFTIKDNKNRTAIDYILRQKIKEHFQADLIPENIQLLWTRAYAKWTTSN
jgi:hypothetical protein